MILFVRASAKRTNFSLLVSSMLLISTTSNFILCVPRVTLQHHSVNNISQIFLTFVIYYFQMQHNDDLKIDLELLDLRNYDILFEFIG